MSQSDNFLRRFPGNRDRLKVILFSLFGFFIVAVSLTFFALNIDKPYIGITLFRNGGIWEISITDFNGIANQAGIREGDIPVAINGQPAEIFLEKYEKTGVVFGRLIEELTAVDNNGQLHAVALKNSSPTWEGVFEQIAWLFVCFAFWITGFYIFFKRQKSAAALLLCLCGLAFGLILNGNMAVERGIPTTLWIEVAATVISPWLLLHFFLVLPEERVKLRQSPLVYLIYLPAAITLLLFPLFGYADGQPLPGFRSFRLLEYGVGFLASAGVAVLNYFRAASIRTRQQMKIVLIGCLAALVPFLVLNVIPDAIWREHIIPPAFSVLFITFIPLGMGYAVVTQKLMDIDVVVRRGLVYGLITVIMAIILSVAIFAASVYHISIGTLGQVLLALVLGGIATILFGPMKKGIESLLDRFIYKDRYDYRKIILSLSISLESVNDSIGISRLIVGTLVNTLNLAGGCLFVKTQARSFQLRAAQGTFADTNRQKQMVTVISERSQMIEFPNSASTVLNDLAYLIPLIAGEKEVGVLCLSQKISRQDFSFNDIYLLQGIIPVAAIALHSAMLIHDVSMRDTFVSVASHELRTPLTSIMGYADLLLRRDPPDVTRKRWLQNIFSSSQRLSSMVDDLLNVSRIQSGKVNIKLERVRLADVFQETLSLTEESNNKHEFVIKIESDLPDLFVDRDKFSHIIGNLLSNAIKYSPNGGRVTLSARNDNKQHQIVLSVADEGIGISPEDREPLFTTFHRIQRPETQGIRGSGLGLYIVKEWVEAMGGKIWLESELNKGSTFFIAIPIKDSGGTG
jgi:signal transduction histidine kinase